MDFVMSGRFIVGLIIGAALYHLWMSRMNKMSNG
jgi:hypothetical protein